MFTLQDVDNLRALWLINSQELSDCFNYGGGNNVTDIQPRRTKRYINRVTAIEDALVCLIKEHPEEFMCAYMFPKLPR